MWWEYLIIAAGLLAAVAYVLWTVVRTFRPKGTCCGSSCACPPDSPDSMSVRRRPLVELKRSEPSRRTSG
jgi:hypothetical protein